MLVTRLNQVLSYMTTKQATPKNMHFKFPRLLKLNYACKAVDQAMTTTKEENKANLSSNDDGNLISENLRR